jgi:hypothetical protein
MRTCRCLLLMAILALGACQKKKEPPNSCSLEFCPNMSLWVRFRVVDKNTGQDYFMSSPPKYPLSALSIREGNDKIYFYVDSIYHAINVSNPGAGPHTLTIAIQDLQPDSISFVSKLNMPSCCVLDATLQDLSVDGMPAGASVSDTTILIIRK